MEAKQRLALSREATDAQEAQEALEGSSVSIASHRTQAVRSMRRLLDCNNNSRESTPPLRGRSQLKLQTIDTVGDFYEFFAGAGMARAGLGDRWRCLFANDFDKKKTEVYTRNWGPDNLLCGDVRDVTTSNLTGTADLVWASFPCQDLSLAGGGAGLKGERSGTFWPFWSLMTALAGELRAPAVISLENVCGTLSSHSGKDFKAICKALHDGGYKFGALVIDAVHFVPQSRPRLLIVAVRNDILVPSALCAQEPTGMFYPRSLRNSFGKLPDNLKESWIWWRLPVPPSRDISLSELIEENPHDVPWHTKAETEKLMSMMSDVNLKKVNSAKGEWRTIGTAYKRTRRDEIGRKVQRAEVRFDDIAGCLRTPAGGSSRQLILFVEGHKVRSRLISSRETARLMGLPDNYILPENYNEAYHLTGDGVVVPVVRFLAEVLIEPVVLHAVKRSGK